MFQGFGTEKVEEHVHHIFPHARIVRLDSDSAQLRQQSMRLLKSFQQGDADILLGTQMVAKGHDFPNVTLVGVLNADAGLNVPSYRSTERTFQLLSQVVGRTGRGQKDGEAIIQTYHPHHYVIQTGSKQDYATFYREEMVARKATQYPPYVFLTRLELASQDEVLLTEAMFDLHAYLNEKIVEKDYLIGPNTPYPEKNGPFFRRRFILKFKKKEHMKDLLQDVNELLRTKRQIRFHINVDPYDI
jgi:primosomal protein N' (replication factor Y)